MRALILATVAVVLLASPADAKCIMSYCKDDAPKRAYVTNTHRQRVADIYDPGHDRRIQIRDTDRRIIGYIEKDGTVTNIHRQKVLRIEGLPD